MKTRKLNINQVYILWFLVAGIVALIALYIYFVNVTIFHTAERQELDESITEIKTSISQLELELIDGTREITKDYAYNLGFQEVEEVSYVSRDPSTKLSLLDEIR